MTLPRIGRPISQVFDLAVAPMCGQGATSRIASSAVATHRPQAGHRCPAVHRGSCVSRRRAETQPGPRHFGHGSAVDVDVGSIGRCQMTDGRLVPATTPGPGARCRRWTLGARRGRATYQLPRPSAERLLHGPLPLGVPLPFTPLPGMAPPRSRGPMRGAPPGRRWPTFLRPRYQDDGSPSPRCRAGSGTAPSRGRRRPRRRCWWPPRPRPL